MKDKRAIKRRGMSALNDVALHPHDYYVTLGSYLNNDTFFGRLIRWWERGEASHSSLVFVRKDVNIPVLELHALEGWGVIATEAGALGKEGATLELRVVEGASDTEGILEKASALLGCKYQKPLGFVTKKRADNPELWFCSEYANAMLSLQNCPSHLVSPPWARRSAKATRVVLRLEL